MAISSPVSRQNVYAEFSADTKGAVTPSGEKSLLDMYQYIFEPVDTTSASLVEFEGTGQPILNGTISEVSTTTSSITISLAFILTGGAPEVPGQYEVEVSPDGGTTTYYTPTQTTQSTTTIQEVVESFQLTYGLSAKKTYSLTLKYWNKYNVNNPKSSNTLTITTSPLPFPEAPTPVNLELISGNTAQMVWTSTDWTTP